jgi:hypothetical protein
MGRRNYLAAQHWTLSPDIVPEGEVQFISGLIMRPNPVRTFAKR